MRKIDLYRELRHHRKLAERRNINLGQNKTAKVIMWFFTAFIIIYLVGLAIMFAMIANESDNATSTELMFSLSPFMLALDFSLRFVAQQTPAQLVKPYTLLPIPRYACIDNFIATSILTSGNLIWFAMLLPYTLMSVLFGYGIVTTVMFLMLFWLMILANSQWYAIIRTLVNDSIIYWLIPIGAYALIFSPWYIGKGAGVEKVLDLYAKIGTATDNHNPLPIILAILAIAVLVLINRKVQYVHVMKEIARTEKTRLHRISKFSFLERYGETGQYIQLEIKSILRNKNHRRLFISSSMLVLSFSFIISYTDIYDSVTMSNFWCLYNLVIYGSSMLSRIMCSEGNYLDGLMVRKENILSLLHAKYIFYTATLVFPFLLMLPTVFSGKWSIWMLLSYAVFTVGFQYFVIFQMAVYNKQTIPLNTKFIGKGGMENNYFQVVVQMIVFMIPMVLVSMLQSFFGVTTSYVIMFIIGSAFIATHPLWLRNIYCRFMKKRYTNMESFRATR